MSGVVVALNRGKGQITGRDVHIYDVVSATLIKYTDGTLRL
jgi:hypothetical protein